MGATRKLQGEIDRVLKKVQEGVDVFDSIWNKVYDTENANQKEKFEADLKKEIKKLQRYRDQIKTWIQSSEIKDKKALLDARKQIEREMERFKICEKETKTKAFSKEGLGQQPKTDPKEKAKAETRDWLNNVVSELENQIDAFEAESEGLFVKKGKSKPPRLVHLETSISRHKSHIMKLELILRLLDNDELSPDQVNDVKDFLDDYVERNQEDFDEFSDVDELYNSLPLDKMDSLEDLVALGPSALKVAAAQDQVEASSAEDGNLDSAPRTPPLKSAAVAASAIPAPNVLGSISPTGISPPAVVGNISSRSVNGPAAPPIISGSGYVRSTLESSASASPSAVLSTSAKDEDSPSLPSRRPSPALADIGPSRNLSRGPIVGSGTSQASNVPLGPGLGISTSGVSVSGLMTSEVAKRNPSTSDEKMQSLASPLSNRMILQPGSKPGDGLLSGDSNSGSESSVLGGHIFSPSAVGGLQWRPPSGSSFPNQNESVQFRGRTEIAPDQREKFLQKLQQVQQQGHSSLLNASHLSGGALKQFTSQQQNPLLQQFSSQSQSFSSHSGLGVQLPGNVSSMTSSSLSWQNSANQQSGMLTGIKDADSGQVKIDEQPTQTRSSDIAAQSILNSTADKNFADEDENNLSAGAVTLGSSSTAGVEGPSVSRDPDPSVQPLSSNLGVFGAIGDNLAVSTMNSVGLHQHMHNLQMLEAAMYKLPQPKDSERVKNYSPRRPALTPASYPQVQHPIIDSPAFWERIGSDSYSGGSDTLFYTFYYQPNTYQQYLAARELKKQSWRYHRKYNTWFQRHEEPKITTDEYEQGTYVYFDFYVANDEAQTGWCQRIKTDFTFEYSFLEDELVI